jgi:NADH-quinone oxidoreductase subunit E
MDEAIARYPKEQQRSAAMPLLHLWQEHFGFISDEAVNWIAEKLRLQPINILELVTFYPMFRQARAGKTHIRVCRTLSCAMAGSYQVMENLRQSIGLERKIDNHQIEDNGLNNPVSISSDGNYSIEFVECLASCGTAPVCMVNDELHENVQAENAMSILAQHAVRPYVNPPHPLEHRLIFKNIGRQDWKTDIDTYLDDGGYEQLRKAVTMSRIDIVNEVKTSGLRGRGGAGFPCGVKWSFIKPDEKKPV